MRRQQASAVFGVLLCGAVVAAQGIQSGPRLGATVPGPFHPLAVFHAELPDQAGRKWDFVGEQYGGRPFVLIFARTLGDPLAALLAQLEGTLAKHRDANSKKVFALIVLLSDAEESEKQLKEFRERAKIKHISLAIDNVAGPKSYRVAREADITVLLVNQRKIEANFAFKKDELRDKDVKQIAGDLQKVIEAAERGLGQAEKPRLVSGPQVGAGIPGTFHPIYVVNAEQPQRINMRSEPILEYADFSGALIFARELEGNLLALLTKIEGQIANRTSEKFRPGRSEKSPASIRSSTSV